MEKSFITLGPELEVIAGHNEENFAGKIYSQIRRRLEVREHAVPRRSARSIQVCQKVRFG
jgi:hypothetical protein